MRPKRTCSMKGQNIIPTNFNLLNDCLNIKASTPKSNHKLRSKGSFLDISSNESEGSSKITTKENNYPPILKRLRSQNSRNTINGVLKESNILNSDIHHEISPPTAKRMKLIRSNTCISESPSVKNTNQSKIIKTPSKCVSRKSHVIKNQRPDLTPTPSRYLLRSQSIRGRPSFLDHMFLTPQPPPKPLIEKSKKLTPIDMGSVNNLSLISEYSSVSSNGLSAVSLSRFIKKNTKKPRNEATKKNYIRIMESSFETVDSSSCASVVEDSQNTIPQDPEKRILGLCDQSEIRSWSFYFDEQSSKPLKKIGEGVYGEVFRMSRGNVLKVFPVDGDILANGEEQMTMEDVYPEVFVSRRLSELTDKVQLYRAPNFVQLKKATVLRGKLPAVLIEQWNQYKNTKGTDNECLSFLPEKQKWMALEYEFAGEPLSNYKFNCYSKTRGVIEQISLSLAVAEAALQFEHRDLHWQNILIKPTKRTKLRYKINDKIYWANCNDIFVTIIDFTVARMCVENNTVYMDMADCPEIFEGEGDYQFEIYRMMKTDNQNNWRDFHARSNLYWVHYLIDKLLHETSYPRGDPQSRAIELELRELHGRVLSYGSVQDLVATDDYFGDCHHHDHHDHDHHEDSHQERTVPQTYREDHR